MSRSSTCSSLSSSSPSCGSKRSSNSNDPPRLLRKRAEEDKEESSSCSRSNLFGNDTVSVTRWNQSTRHEKPSHVKESLFGRVMSSSSTKAVWKTPPPKKRPAWDVNTPLDHINVENKSLSDDEEWKTIPKQESIMDWSLFSELRLFGTLEIKSRYWQRQHLKYYCYDQEKDWQEAFLSLYQQWLETDDDENNFFYVLGSSGVMLFRDRRVLISESTVNLRKEFEEYGCSYRRLNLEVTDENAVAAPSPATKAELKALVKAHSVGVSVQMQNPKVKETTVFPIELEGWNNVAIVMEILLNASQTPRLVAPSPFWHSTCQYYPVEVQGDMCVILGRDTPILPNTLNKLAQGLTADSLPPCHWVLQTSSTDDLTLWFNQEGHLRQGERLEMMVWDSSQPETFTMKPKTSLWSYD